MRENAFCMIFHVRWISHHSSLNPTLVASDSETCEKSASHMENHTKCISSQYLLEHLLMLFLCKKLMILYLAISKLNQLTFSHESSCPVFSLLWGVILTHTILLCLNMPQYASICLNMPKYHATWNRWNTSLPLMSPIWYVVHIQAQYIWHNNTTVTDLTRQFVLQNHLQYQHKRYFVCGVKSCE